MSDSFVNRIVSAADNNYEVASVSGNNARMLSMLEWARALRSQGFHLGIFFVNGVLTVHSPREAQGYKDWLSRNEKTIYVLEASYFDRATGEYGPWKTASHSGNHYPTEAAAMKDYHLFYTNHPNKDSGHHTKYRVLRRTVEIIVDSTPAPMSE